MDYYKLIERLKNAAGGSEGIKMCQDAALAIETLLADLARVTAKRDAAVERIREWEKFDTYLFVHNHNARKVARPKGGLTMERLTEKRESGAWPEKGWTDEAIAECLDRLAAYEDTGLEPEEIELLAKQRDLYVDACGELPLKRICELAQADREGRCVIFRKGYGVVSEYEVDEEGFITRTATGVVTREEYDRVLKGDANG